MIHKLLYELEAELVNQASVTNADPLDKLNAMRGFVMEAADAFKILERMFAPYYQEQREQFATVRKRILYYLAHFEYMVRNQKGLQEPDIEDLKELYPLASHQEWCQVQKEVLKVLRTKTPAEDKLQMHLN